MTWVKICGITNLEDAMTAVEAGADALGFVFYEKSPRRLDVETAREIVEKLPARVEKVGVFVDGQDQSMAAIANRVGLTAAQVHCVENYQPAIEGLDTDILFAIPAAQVSFSAQGRGLAWGSLMKMPARLKAIVLDSGTVQKPGGTGVTFDWQATRAFLSAIGRHYPVVVAGGLNSTNVAEAMRILHPWGVDVASGVEARPGKKDPEKVRAFVAAVREADKVH